MTIDRIRAACLAFPHVTEQMQWGDNVLFKIGGKMFCVVSLEVPAMASFRVPEERFHELIENEDVIPAPYMARAGWIQLRRLDALSFREVETLLRYSYGYYYAKLAKNVREGWESKPLTKKKRRKQKR